MKKKKLKLLNEEEINRMLYGKQLIKESNIKRNYSDKLTKIKRSFSK